MSLNRPCFQTYDYDKYIKTLQRIYTDYGPYYDNDYTGSLKDGVESPQKTVLYDLLKPYKYLFIQSFNDCINGIKSIFIFITMLFFSLTIYLYLFVFKYIKLTYRNHKIIRDSRYIYIKNHVNKT